MPGWMKTRLRDGDCVGSGWQVSLLDQGKPRGVTRWRQSRNKTSCTWEEGFHVLTVGWG